MIKVEKGLISIEGNRSELLADYTTITVALLKSVEIPKGMLDICIMQANELVESGEGESVTIDAVSKEKMGLLHKILGDL